MITTKHLKEELDNLEQVYKEKNEKEYQRSILKSNILIAKLLQNIRTNQVLSLEANGINLVEGRKTNE